jgi:polar amino acid transport system substrate-binding protein
MLSKFYFLIPQWFKTSSHKKWIYLIGALFLIFLISVMRGCSNQISPHTVFKIGRDPRWYSLNLMGKERNMTAFTDELLVAIAKVEKLRIEFISDKPAELLPKLENGTIDGVFSAITPDVRTEENFIFSEPYFRLGAVLVIPIQSKTDTREELTNKIIGVQSNLATSLNLQQDSSIRVQLYDNILQALTDLDDNRIDGAIFPALPAYIYTSTFYPTRLKIVTSPLTDEGLRLIALKNERGAYLIQHFNHGLSQLKEEGTYDQLIEKWGLVLTEKG